VSGNVGARGLAFLAGQLEAAARTGEREGLSALAAAAAAEWEAVRPALVRELDGPSS
jgi:hypothetical protein